jgi:hypothetical protein
MTAAHPVGTCEHRGDVRLPLGRVCSVRSGRCGLRAKRVHSQCILHELAGRQVSGRLAEVSSRGRSIMSAMISYSHLDRAVADGLIDHLRSENVSAWIDHQKIAQGAQWRDELMNQLRECDA